MRLPSVPAASPLVRRYLGVMTVDVMVKGANLLLLPVYLRLMSQEEFGLFGYLAAIIGTFALVLNGGMYVVQSKLYHEYPAEQRGAMLFSLNVLLAGALAVVLVPVLLLRLDDALAAFLFRVSVDYHNYRVPVLAALAVAVYAPLLTNFFLLSDAIARVQAYNLARVVLVNAVVIGMLLAWPAEDAVLVRVGVASGIEIALICVFALNYVRHMRPRFLLSVARRALAIGAPVVVSALVGIFVNLGDRWFIERYGSRHDLSVYNLALVIAGVIPFAFASFQGVWLPQLLRERDAQLARERSGRMMRRMLAAFAVMAVAAELAVFAALRTGVIDAGYERVLFLLPIAMATAIFASLTGMYTNLLLHIDRLGVIVVAGITAAIAGVLLNMALVPRFGVAGAAVAASVLNLAYLLCYRAAAAHYLDRHALREQRA